MEKLDCKGQACPLPVVNAKKALAGMGEGALRLWWTTRRPCTTWKTWQVAQGRNRLRGARRCRVRGGLYQGCAGRRCGMRGVPALVPAGSKVVVLSSEFMGAGDDELGATLMKAFVFALTQQDELPAAILPTTAACI